MAEQSHLLTTLREALSDYDDEAFSALANKGLLRRAYKDLESANLAVTADEGSVATVDTGEAVVSLLLPLQGSSCTCPTSGICRHILLALLWIKQEAGSSDEPDPVFDSQDLNTVASGLGDEICALSDDALHAWAGKPHVRKAVQKLSKGTEVTWSEGRTIDFRFPGLDLTCRWMPGQGPAGMVCDCHAAPTCEHRVIAILAYQVSRGVREILPESDSPPPQALDRTHVLREIGDALHAMIAHGFSHLSEADYERFNTLSISAHAADLPRMERLVRSLSTELQLQLSRDAQADIGNLLHIASRIEVLRTALRHPTPGLLGRHRSEYFDVKRLEIQGLGMAQWRTKTGHIGLTIYFWDSDNNQWLTWSDSRPPNSPDGFSPENRRHAPGPWENCASPEEICRKRLTLRGAKISAVGRISGREETVATVGGAAATTALWPITTWDAIAERAIEIFSGAFADSDDRDSLIYIEPADWGDAQFDEIAQELQLPLHDAGGKTVSLMVPFSEGNANLIGLIEEFVWSPGVRVLGRLGFRDSGIYIEPLVIHQDDRTINLTLDKTPVRSRRLAPINPSASTPNPVAPSAAPGTRLGVLLASALVEIETIAEGGLSARYDTARLQEMSSRCSMMRLERPAEKMRRFLTELERNRRTVTPNSKDAARLLLQSYHLLHLSQMMDTLLLATRDMR